MYRRYPISITHNSENNCVLLVELGHRVGPFLGHLSAVDLPAVELIDMTDKRENTTEDRE